MPVCKEYDRATTDPVSRSRTALDAVNFFLADVHGGLGPYLAVYLGAIGTAQGIGAALSAAVAGGMVTPAGYSAAFLLLAGIAAAGLALFWIAMPETRPADEAA
jgi:hypothetical protein